MSPRILPLASLFGAFALCVVVMGSALAQTPHKGPTPKMRPMAGPGNIVGAPRFRVQIGGQTVASFQELSGINTEVEPTQYLYTKNGNTHHTKQFGKTKPPTITLKRGLDSKRMMWAWHQQVLAGSPTARKDAVLVVYNGNTPGPKYILKNAWPSKVEISGMKAGNSAAVMETVTLQCDSIQYLPAK